MAQIEDMARTSAGPAAPGGTARIRSIDTRAAEALPGVYAVMVGAELPTAYCVIPWTPDETALAIFYNAPQRAGRLLSERGGG